MRKRINKHVDEININGLKVIYCFDDIMQTKPPVAGWDSKGAFRTNKKYSEFTESMINAYLGGEDVGRKVKQHYVDKLAWDLQNYKYYLDGFTKHIDIISKY